MFRDGARDTDALLVGVELVGFGLVTLAGCKLLPWPVLEARWLGKSDRVLISGTCAGLPLGPPDWLLPAFHVTCTHLTDVDMFFYFCLIF